MTYDLIIVGGSAAATASGIYSARRKLNFKIITLDLGGEVATSGIIENWPGIIRTDGITLAKNFAQHLKYYNAPIEEFIEAREIRKEGNIFIIKSQKKTDGMEIIQYQAKTVIIATGVHPRKLDIPGEKEFLHKGLSYCTTCDGPLFKEKVVAVIGGGNAALESALMLSNIAKKVFVLNKNSTFKGEEILIEKVLNDKNIEVIYNALTRKIIGKNFVTGIVYDDAQSKEEDTLEVQGIFVHIGMIPNSHIVSNVQKNPFGEIVVSKKCETSISGLFAAGDVTDISFKQIAICVGQGVTAALSAVEYLNKSC